MKYLVACSAFITDEGGCAPIYIDLVVYIMITAGLILLYLMTKKLVKHLRTIKR